MIRYLEEELVRQEDNHVYDDVLPPSDITVAQFCQFVDYYTRHSTDPMSTAAVCEHQAEEIYITPHDVSQETIDLLIATMLNVINHLEKKWLDEQLQREELLHREVQEQKQETTRRTPWYQVWVRRPWTRFVRGKYDVPFVEHTV